MRVKIQLKQIASYSKGSQINGDKLVVSGVYDYLNGGVAPSGKWDAFNTPGGTVTISEGGNSCGYVNYMREPFWCGAHCYYLFDTIRNSEYLYYALKSQQERLMGIRTGACMPNIKKADLGRFEITYDTDEQQQEYVVSILRKVESIIAARQQQLIELDNLIKARFVELFGDPKYNKSNLVKIGEIGALTSGGTPSRAKPEYFEGDVRWYSAGELNSLYLSDSVEHISEMALQQSSAKLFNKGTLMIGMYDTAAFKMGILTEDSSSNQACANLNPKQGYNIVWLYYLFDIMKPIFLQERQGVRQKNLSLSKIKEFEVPFAPFELQDQFAAFVEQTDKSKVVVQKAVSENANTAFIWGGQHYA